MQYTDKTASYNDRRYGKPWMAYVTTSLTKDFQFIDWDGRPGYAGEFSFDAEPGTIVAYGQKDLRKNRGGVEGYQICLPDGSMPVCSSMAADLRKMPTEQRWRKYCEVQLAKAVNRPNGSEYEVAEWAKTRNEHAAKYSAMLGIDDPVKDEIAQALGLTAQPAIEESHQIISMDAFGV